MSNAEIIARTLDDCLDHEISLVIYGRAAIAPGFDHTAHAVALSQDIDVIVQSSRAADLEGDDQFWQAQAEVNARLHNQGLYITHLFEEDQVFLRPDWERHIVPLARPDTRWLSYSARTRSISS